MCIRDSFGGSSRSGGQSPRKLSQNPKLVLPNDNLASSFHAQQCTGVSSMRIQIFSCDAALESFPGTRMAHSLCPRLFRCGNCYARLICCLEQIAQFFAEAHVATHSL